LNDAPDFTFKLAFSECGAFRPRDCVYDISNGFGSTGGTRYGFFTPLSPRAPAPAIPERACGRCNGTTIGMPIDVATGELWNEKTDLALSGPFGLSFTRFYGSQTAGSADLGGTNWRHAYAVDLDVSNAGNGKVTYYDTEGTVLLHRRHGRWGGGVRRHPRFATGALERSQHLYADGVRRS